MVSTPTPFEDPMMAIQAAYSRENLQFHPTGVNAF